MIIKITVGCNPNTNCWHLNILAFGFLLVLLTDVFWLQEHSAQETKNVVSTLLLFPQFI